jgi:pimeloyl-ACP methyl ester carboxylesterase
MKRLVLIIGCIVLMGIFNQARSQHIEKKFTREINYLLYIPDGYGKDTTVKWPLILFLHGGAERGNNLEKVKANGPPKLISKGKKFPFIIVSPQVPSGELWDPDLLVWMLKDIITKYKVDEERIYLTGLSIGGHGTWQTSEKYPELFAAIAPVSGWGDPLQAWKIRHTPVWIFHGAKDPVVPVIASVVMADSLKRYNNVQLTVYPNAVHDCWTETYNNDNLYKWFLEHKKFRFVQSSLTGSPEKFTGLFLSDNDTANVFQNEGKLWISYGFKGSGKEVMKPIDRNTFFLNENELTEIKYITDTNGSMSSFIFYSNSKKIFNRVKQK